MSVVQRVLVFMAICAGLLWPCSAPGSPAPLASAAPPPAGGIAVIADDAPTADAIRPAGLSELEQYVDGIVASLRQEHGLPALSVAVVRHDQLMLARGYGLADVATGTPVVADGTLFRIGSVSKTFVWTAVMMLVERGQLDLDADINTYLQGVKVAEAFGAPVTMRQLMHHRAGFEDSMRLFAVGDDDPRSLAELLAEQQPARVYPPGARTSYSNWGAALAAQVVADVSGRAYGEFLQVEILDPLGMQSTTFVAPSKLDEATRARLASGYQDGKGALALQDYMQIGAYWPSGGMASTATDMARWMRFHLNGGELEGLRLLSAETHAQMWTRAYSDRAGAADVAHGFQDRNYRGLRMLGHGGATAAFYTNMMLVPELGLGVYVSQNSRQTRVSVNQLPELVVDHLRERAFQADLVSEATDPGALAELAGTYLQNRRVFSSFAAVMGMGSTATVMPVAPDVLVLTLNGKSTQYRRVGEERDLFEAATGARIAFVREGEQVVALADPSGVHTLEKVDGIRNPNITFAALGGTLLLSLSTLIGFGWRLGRGPSYGRGPAARMAAMVSLCSALAVLVFLAAIVRMVIAFEALDIAAMTSGYPLPAMLQAHYAGWLLCATALAAWLSLPSAWRAEGWGLWRRLHFSVFALLLGVTAYLLWHWRVVGAGVY